MMEGMDPAARLGVPWDADAAAVRAGFARRMRAVHPDTAGEVATDASAVAALIGARDLALARLASGAPPREPAKVVFYPRRRLLGGAGHRQARRVRPRRSRRVLR
jgi:curved DNA-binding protein CbpA